MSEGNVGAAGERVTETVDPSDVINSFTGFDELAIERLFRMSFAKMGESTMALRSVDFILRRREGMKDADAYKAAMNVTFGDLAARYQPAEDDVQGEANGPDSTATTPTS